MLAWEFLIADAHVGCSIHNSELDTSPNQSIEQVTKKTLLPLTGSNRAFFLVKAISAALVCRDAWPQRHSS
jgi:hypothetical protein